MTIFSCNGLTKRFDRDFLFEDISLGMEEGERIGIIGKNGIGKTTLLNIIANSEYPDSGSVVFNNNVRFEYLTQEPVFDSIDSVISAVMNAKPEVNSLLDEYHSLCYTSDKNNSNINSTKIEELTHKIELADGWNLENEAKKILTKLGLINFEEIVQTLSGGLRKRVALAKALLSEPELLIMDEPTNHLDADSVQWLQDRLLSTKGSLLFVTHDRYFLDAIATKIVEIDQKRIYNHPGSYEDYLERRESILSTQTSTVEHLLSRLRSELAWLQKGARARRKKQKSRIDWVEKLKNEAKLSKEKKIKIELGKTFLGSRIIEAHNIKKSLGGKLLFNDFTYIAKPGDRFGIIGPNGSGKSTLLNVLCEKMEPDSGTVKIGGSVKFGYFTQDLSGLNDNDSVIGSLRDIAEYIDVGEGRDRYITAKDLLNRFLFPLRQHSSLISTLSGGEKRRLALLKVLMGNPNVIFLDEPTNDFDLDTLTAIENYLDNFYGVLLIVSHDRAFLDRTVNFIHCFDGNGNIKEYPGNYSNYLERKEAEDKIKSGLTSITKDKTKNEKRSSGQKKLSYLEQREFNVIESKISKLEEQKAKLQALINSGNIINYKDLEQKSNELFNLENQIELATLRWIELSEKVE